MEDQLEKMGRGFHPPSSTRRDVNGVRNTPFKWIGLLPRAMPFGLRWQDEVYGIGAIVLAVSDYAIHEITVFPRAERSQSDLHDDALVADENHRVVELAGGEYITEIAVRRNERSEVWGIQFVTNMRMHPWIGNSYGFVERVRAERGYYISSLMAEPLPRDMEELSAGGRMCKLGCRFDLLSSRQSVDRDVLSRDASVRKSAEINFRDPDAVDKPFFHAFRQLQALIITCRNGVENLTMFTQEQYDRYLKTRDRPLGWNELWVVLAENDRIASVEVAHSNGTFALRFRTRKTLTCWYGRRLQRELDTITEFQARGDEAVCGFFGSLTNTGQVCSLGVVFASPTGEPQSDDELGDECTEGRRSGG